MSSIVESANSNVERAEQLKLLANEAFKGNPYLIFCFNFCVPLKQNILNQYYNRTQN